MVGVNPTSPASTVTTTAFVGRTLRGPVNTPVIVSSFAEYLRIFGAVWQPSTLSQAIEMYFEHGGTRAVVVRVVNGATSATLRLPCGDACLVLEALAPGSREFLRASVDYDNIADDDTQFFNLVLQRVRVHQSEHVEEQETYRRVSVSPTTGRHVATVLLESRLVRVRGDVPAQRPAPTPGIHGRLVGYVDSGPDGNDGAPLTDYDLIGSARDATGLFALNGVERVDFVYLPPLTREQDVGASALLVALRYCRERHAMLIVDPPLQWTDVPGALSGSRDLKFNSEQAVMFFPRVVMHDRTRGRSVVFANGGAVAGMLSHADQTHPVWDVRRQEPELLLRPGVRLQVELSELDRWRLAAQGINALQTVRRAVPVSLLRRTMAGGANAAADWSYLGARRFALHVMGTLQRNTRWVLLSGAGRVMWARLVRQVNAFLHELVALGALSAPQPGREFFVVCDERINAPTAGDDSGVRILVGFAGIHSSQYHSFLISHSLAGSCVRMAAVNHYETSSNFEDVEQTGAMLGITQQGH